MPSSKQLDRRNFLQTACGVGALALLAGCSSQSSDPVETAENSVESLAKRLAALRGQRPTRTARPPKARPEVSGQGMPAMVPRSYWGASNPTPSRLNRMTCVNRLTVHHEGCPKANWSTAPDDVAKTLRIIQASHRKRLKAGDIGYHFVIDRTGRIWEGRSLGYQGAHVRGNNSGNVGIMLLGNFDIQQPTESQLSSLHRLSSTVIDHYGIATSRVFGHCDLVATRCPGRNLHRRLGAIRGLIAKA